MTGRGRARAGFTLIELAIVLSIIALVAGGLLIGREVVAAAEIRSLIRQVEQYDTAVSTFKAKYDCLPGDCPWAVAFGLGDAGGDGADGNGNGVIDVLRNDSGYEIGPETQNFWVHLSRSGLGASNVQSQGIIPGLHSPPLAKAGVGKMGNRSGGLWVVNQYHNQFWNNPGYDNPRPIPHVWLTITDTNADSVVGAYLSLDVYAVDGKVDDGLPASGRVQMSNGSRSLRCSQNRCYGLNAEGTGSGYPDSCYNDRAAEPRYNQRPRYSGAISNAAYCTLVIRTAF